MSEKKKAFRVVHGNRYWIRPTLEEALKWAVDYAKTLAVERACVGVFDEARNAMVVVVTDDANGLVTHKLA